MFSRSEPVIFFPGTLCDERIFMPLWQSLKLDSKAFVPLQWAQDLEQMMALSNDRIAYFDQAVHLLGYSMGGYVAALAALDAFKQSKTQKAGFKIASLTLLNSSAQALGDEELAQRKLVTKLIKDKRYKGMPNSKAEAMLHEQNRADKALVDSIVTMSNDLGASTLLAQTSATANRKNLLPELAKLPIPIQFIVGEQDTIAPPTQVETASKGYANMRVSVLNGAGHMMPLEQSEALAELLINPILA
ncbi:alpha/beta fold hydrolase [Glaciecola sp. MH2013]|uniref:alpha/beta fold hydrolase n=1 Tax=Glaciecola sp. MH2013 TaxID=2785524 RepID=UPI00189F4F11|nr:alpha/beta fold hydrolase [Glaciecola sp. MH2013]MBF7074717.1 alpha/beta fold hydrolase [Glaciecola sp. MH2013]